MRKYVKSNDGYALVIALLVITVVTVLGLGILTTTSSSKKLSEEENKDQTAYYIAEAGLNQKKEELKDAKVVYDDFVNSLEVKGQKLTKPQFIEKLDARAKLELKQQLEDTTYGSDLFNRKNARANVKTVMTVSETELKFTITSTGIIKSNDSSNEKKRTVQSVDSYSLNISDNGDGLGKYTAYLSGSNNALSMSGRKSYIQGDIGFSSPPNGTFVKNFKHDGNVFFNASAPYKPFPNDKFKNFTDKTCIACKDFNTLKENSIKILNEALEAQPNNPKTTIKTGNILEGDYQLTKTSLVNTGTYTVKEGKNVRIFIDEFPDNSGILNLNFLGNGNIYFYVNKVNIPQLLNLDLGENNVYFFSKKDDIDFKGSVNINHAKSLHMYSYDDIEMQGAVNITNVSKLSFFARDDIDLNGSLNISKGEEINFLAAAVKKDGTEADDSSLDLEGSIAFYDAKRINFFAEEDIDLEGSLRILGTNFADTFNLCAKKEIEFENSYELDVKEIHAFAGKSIEFDPNNKLEEKNKKGIIIHRGTFELFTPELEIDDFTSSYFNTENTTKKSGPTNFYVTNKVDVDKQTIYDNFNIYYTGKEDVDIDNNLDTTINFDILNNFIDFKGQALKGTPYKGVIVLRYPISSEIKLSSPSNGYGSIHFYAPQATLKVNVNKGFYGALGGKKIHGSGNKELYYKAPYSNSILKSSSSGGGNNGSISSDISKNPDGGSIEVNNP